MDLIDVTSKNQEEQYQALEKYGVDLVKQVRQGKQDPIIGLRSKSPYLKKRSSYLLDYQVRLF